MALLYIQRVVSDISNVLIFHLSAPRALIIAISIACRNPLFNVLKTRISMNDKKRAIQTNDSQ